MTDTILSRAALRTAVLEDIVTRAEIAAVPMEGGPLDGIDVISLGTLRDEVTAALTVPLPAASDTFAEVRTPATIVVAAICPECELPTTIRVALTAQLTVDDDGKSLAVKAKTKASAHVCNQLPLPAAVEGQETLDGAIDDLRVRILRAVADVSDEWGDPSLAEDNPPPPTLDAIAKRLELATESDIGDLEESLHSYSQAEEPLVLVKSPRGEVVRYFLTEAGLAFVEAADAEDVDDASGMGDVARQLDDDESEPAA